MKPLAFFDHVNQIRMYIYIDMQSVGPCWNYLCDYGTVYCILWYIHACANISNVYNVQSHVITMESYGITSLLLPLQPATWYGKYLQLTFKELITATWSPSSRHAFNMDHVHVGTLPGHSGGARQLSSEVPAFYMLELDCDICCRVKQKKRTHSFYKAKARSCGVQGSMPCHASLWGNSSQYSCIP